MNTWSRFLKEPDQDYMDEITLTCAVCGAEEIVNGHRDLPGNWIVLIDTVSGLEEVYRWPSWWYCEAKNFYCSVECYENQ